MTLMVVQLYDLSKYFDKEVQSDTLDVLHRRKVDPKACRVWAKLNDTRIQARTGVGKTEWAEIGECIGQGTIGGALASQASLDDGVEAQFGGSLEEIQYGSVEMGPILFQDDIAHGAQSLLQARIANMRMDFVVKEKRLSLNESKSVVIFMGSEKIKTRARVEISEKPLMCGRLVTKEIVRDKWLGDYLHTGGLGESVMETIRQRMGKVKGAVLEVAAIVEDYRAQLVGGFETGLLLWETCCIPSLLHNAGTWVELPGAAVKELNRLQDWTLRLFLRQGLGVPTASLGARSPRHGAESVERDGLHDPPL